MSHSSNSIILDIYDTIIDQHRWSHTLDKIARAVGGRGCIVFELTESHSTTPALRASHFSAAYDPELISGYINGFSHPELAEQSAILNLLTREDEIEVFGEEHLPSAAGGAEQGANVQALAAFGIHHRAAAFLNKDNRTRDRFAIQFSRRHGPLAQTDRKILNEILPHVAKALELGRVFSKIQGSAGALADAINRLRIGICLIRANRQVVCENNEFRRQREEAGVFFQNRKGQLEMRDAASQNWFYNMTSEAHRHGQFGARPRKEALGGLRSDSGKLAVEIAPLTSANAFGERQLDGYIVYSLDTARKLSLDLGLLSKVLTLTQSEADLVGFMAEGLTNREISQRRDRSIETVNSQVKSLLSKTDCANRTQLIRLASSIGATLTDS